MKKTTTSLLNIAAASLLLGAPQLSQGAIVTLNPDGVPRLNEFSGGNSVQEYFSTNTQVTNNQYTIVTTYQSTFLGSLDTDLNGGSPLAQWQAYQINSATLTVGADVDSSPTDESRYEQASRAHVMTTSYDFNDVSWNNSDQSTTTAWGGGTIDTTGGTDWESAVQATGVVGTGITTFDLTSYVVGVMDGTYSGAGEGLFFETTDPTLGQKSRTQAANVSWTLDAQIITVPEPSSTALLGLGGLALVLRRKRS